LPDTVLIFLITDSVITGFLQVRENWRRSGNFSGQGKCKNDWKIGEMFGKIITSDNFKKKKVSDRNMLGIRTDAKSVLKAMCKKLLYLRQSLIQ